MKPSQKLHIYDRREVFTFLALFFMGSVFAFTLGIHLGKRIGRSSSSGEVKETPLIGSVPDKVPSRQELTEQGKGVERTIEETLTLNLKEEVTHSGIKLETAHQVHLPENLKAVQTPPTKPSAEGEGEEKSQEGKYVHKSQKPTRKIPTRVLKARGLQVE